MVNAIINAGYTHLDTASCYKNEEVVGNAIAECIKQGKKREELFVTTKIWHTEYGDVEGALRTSLEKL